MGRGIGIMIMGSGSTGMACVEEEFDFVGIELDEKYCQIAEKRITEWDKIKNPLKPEFLINKIMLDKPPLRAILRYSLELKEIGQWTFIEQSPHQEI